MYKFVDAFNVVRGFLFLLLMLKEYYAGVVSELAQKALGFVACAHGFVVGV